MGVTDLTTVVGADGLRAEDIASLLHRVTAASGGDGLSEHKRMVVLGAGAGHSPAAALAGAVEARSRPEAPLVGFAPVVDEVSDGHYAVELAVDPDADDPAGLADALLEAAIALVVRCGGGSLRLWSPGATADDDRRARTYGLRRERDLIQMRCLLPLDPAVRGSHPLLTTRPFRSGADDQAWLVVNNRAFGDHPEQGHWDLAELHARLLEPWFDPDGLLLVEENGRLAGSCWTKVHADTEPPMGEIYVIAIDPDFQGRGWGRALTEAGLDWLAGQGLTVGMLYVDADNAAAVSLYRSMGFIDHHTDRAYVGTFT
jgi:mycothiol synthase